MFSYPLTPLEISEFTGINLEVVKRRLELLAHKIHLEKNQEFYGLRNIKANVIQRIEANRRAEKVMPKALKRGRLILRFPFVKAVFISGSLSKYVMPIDGDVDFFVITQPNRLWIARILLTLYKKVILLNSRQFFCINYYVTTNALQIEEQNLFTATEIVTAIPVDSTVWHQRFLNANKWVSTYYANNALSSEITSENAVSNHRFNSFWNTLDTLCMQITKLKWKSKFRFMPSADFELAMKSSKTVSKHHPHNYQKKVLNRYADIYNEVAKEVAQTECVDEGIV